MRPAYLTEQAISSFIDLALQEDIGEGDHSSLGAIPANTIRTAHLLIKDNGIIAGLELSEKIFYQVDSALKTTYFKKDGDAIRKGEVAFEVTGPARSILSAERLVLNCMQRMSGIATYTHQLCQLIEGTAARLLDTRKTTPNFRLMEKWAVWIGGGQNHRFALYDMVMLKDNHIDYAGGIQQAIERTNNYLKSNHKALKIEIEVRNADELQQVLAVGQVDRIMLDNFTPEQIKAALPTIPQQFEVEASGGITLDNIRAYAETGVDFISVGALTHSFKSLDMSLKADFS